ncbi:MAG TPA: universal stress protein, partial [Actinomycetota bacterium]|nr:universal stress protein [Actinomycetota bacterium]
MAYRRIVVATDGSDSAETAETIASTLASIGGAKLTIAHAYANPDRANEAVARAEEIADREGARHELALSADAPADAILMTADATDAELIVIGSVGFATSDQLFGSVSRRVVTHAPCDVLLTRARTIGEHGRPAAPYRRMLIATDGSSTADRAARKGYVLAKALKASVTLLFVGHPKTGELVLQDTVATIGSESGVPSAIEIRSGDPS